MDAENLLNLFDSCWFEPEILRKQAHPLTTNNKTLEFPNPDIPAISTRSMDELVSSSSSGSSISSFSPNSVLPTRRLRPIFSGKEMKDLLSEQEEEDIEEASRTTPAKAVEIETTKSCSGEQRRKSSKRGTKNRRLQRAFSKSLSDLEFEEIKGFMELGFVFSAEDKRSEFLATILPGLQRLGVEEEVEKKKKIGDGSGVSRPYLSEVWQTSEMNNKMRKRGNRPMTMSWEELPSVNSKIDMKDYLKSWVQTVVSSVK